MDVLPSFVQFLQPFFQEMTGPTFASLLVVLIGWIHARRHHLSGGLRAVEEFPKHYSSYYHVFAKASWSLDAVGLGLAGLILSLACAAGATVDLVIDDTLCRKCGHKMFGVGSHYDPLATGRKLSNASQSITSRGHCWVILSVVIQFPFRPGFYFALPVLFRLYLNKKSAARHEQDYSTKPELALQILTRLCGHFAQRHFHLLVDSGYGGQTMLKGLPANCGMTAQWVLNARLTALPPAKSPHRKGRQPKWGKALPNPRQMLQEPGKELELNVYGEHRRYRVADTLACLYTVPGKLLHIVATQALDLTGRPRPDLQAVFYSTVTDSSAEQVLTRFAGRWSVEVTIHDTKQQLGLEQPQGYSPLAVQRTAPTLLLLYSLIVLWFAQVGHRTWRTATWPWYPQKQYPGFADMLAHLRHALLRYQLRTILRPSAHDRSVKQILKAAGRLISLAA